MNTDTMTSEQKDCFKTLAEWCGGEHHMQDVKPFGAGIAMSWSGDLATYDHDGATYDYDGLTRLVILAHRDAIRFGVTCSGPRMVKICAWKRQGGPRGELSMSSWHPSLTDLRIQIEQASK